MRLERNSRATMQSGVGRSPGGAVNSKSQSQISRKGARLSMSLRLPAESLERRMLEAVDDAPLEGDAKDLVELQVRPSRFRPIGGGFENVVGAQGHVARDTHPALFRHPCGFQSGAVPVVELAIWTGQP